MGHSIGLYRLQKEMRAHNIKIKRMLKIHVVIVTVSIQAIVNRQQKLLHVHIHV